MAIGALDEEAFVRVLQEHLRPSSPIESFEHLYGRERQLDQIKQAMYSPGRHVFIYGDRGVGKTSLARTAAFQHHPSDGEPIAVACGTGTTFVSLMNDIIANIAHHKGVAQAKDTTKTSFGIKGASVERTVERQTGRLPEVKDINTAIENLKLLTTNNDSRVVVIVDEFDQLKASDDQQRFAEFIKQLGDQTVKIAFIFCGIGKSLDDLLAAHASSYRYLEGIELPRLHWSGRWEIIDRSSAALELKINEDSRFRIAAISDGFPHYIHLICEKLYWHLFSINEKVALATPNHFVQAIRDTCYSIESHLRLAYEKATMKDNDVYEEVLWALADHFELKRSIDAIYRSYERIMGERGKSPLNRTKFVSRLNNLKSPRHGDILRSDRRSWYEFRESMVRGYVRLRAEEKGVRLALEHEPSPEPTRLTVGKTRQQPTGVIPRPQLGGDPYKSFGKE
ncbi:MAG TPA: ATP-binding protein [Burkholderiales bacterium]|nr:ATP-binding protein [Burkholderiales bacterium]